MLCSMNAAELVPDRQVLKGRKPQRRFPMKNCLKVSLSVLVLCLATHPVLAEEASPARGNLSDTSATLAKEWQSGACSAEQSVSGSRPITLPVSHLPTSTAVRHGDFMDDTGTVDTSREVTSNNEPTLGGKNETRWLRHSLDSIEGGSCTCRFMCPGLGGCICGASACEDDGGSAECCAACCDFACSLCANEN
jgi:hypothetical protein